MVQAYPSINAGLKNSIAMTGIALEEGKRYFVSVTVCHAVACYQVQLSFFLYVLNCINLIGMVCFFHVLVKHLGN